MTNQVKIYDTTLRDGEQTPRVAFSPEQKLKIAKIVSDIGCHIIDAGFPLASRSEAKALQLILDAKNNKELRDDLEILVMCRASEADIDRTVEVLNACNHSPDKITLLLFTASSDAHLKLKLGNFFLKRKNLAESTLEDLSIEWFRQENIQLTKETIAYAKSKGFQYIEFGAEDASRTPIGTLIDLVKTAVEAGANRYIFSDTVGTLCPETTAFYCQQLRQNFPHLPIVGHFHNDLDLATANALTACRNGINIISTTINGLGERAGNASLHSVVAALKYIDHIQIPGFRYEMLNYASSQISEMCGLPLSINEPVVGMNVFTHESGVHVHGVLKSPNLYEIIPCDRVGGKRHFVFGKHSGSSGVRYVLSSAKDLLNENGVEVDEALIEIVMAYLKSDAFIRDLSVKRKSIVDDFETKIENLGISENDLIQIAFELSRRSSKSKHTKLLGSDKLINW